MANPFPHVRHSGCRSPLALTLLILAIVFVFTIFTIPSILPSGNIKVQEFFDLIKQDYNEAKFTANQITATDYDNLNTKITAKATNSTKQLVVDNTLVIDNFISPDTTLNGQLILNGKDIACLLNLAIQQSITTTDSENSATKMIKILSFTLDTVQDITSIQAVCQVDISSLQNENDKQDPSNLYLTLYGEIKNTPSNYIVSSSIRINDLNDSDNAKATSFLQEVFKINSDKNLSQTFIDELVRLMRTINSTLQKSISLTAQYLIIG